VNPETAGIAIIFVGILIMAGAVTAAFARKRPPERSFWLGGVLLHGAMVAAIVLSAYADCLPLWSQGRTLANYDTFMHFYLTGLLTFFMEGMLRQPPIAIGRWIVPRVMLALVALSAFDELILQPLASNRSSTLHDLIGNAAGAIVMGYLGYFARQRGELQNALVGSDPLSAAAAQEK
jgi:hypothetical protein